jgi:hypothetical protein
VTPQNIADGLMGDLIAEIGERADHSIEALRTVLVGHTNNQFLDVSLDRWSARRSTGRCSVEFARICK